MLSIYDKNVCDLKIRLKNKNIKFNKLFSLINNQKYDEIAKIIPDEIIQTLIKNIVSERESISNNMENKLNSLLWLNERLIQFGENTQSSKKKALKILKTKVFINIYDLEAEKYAGTTKELLRKELRKKCDRRFPLCMAKENKTLKLFLIKL